MAPPSLHDHFRKDRGGQATHHRVMRAIELLQKHNVDYNVLCVVNAVNSQHPLDVYGFFREIGAQFIQFIPMVETHPDGGVSLRSVSGRAFGKFLIAIFNAWAAHDLGDVYVQIFEEAAESWLGYLPLCVCSAKPVGGLRSWNTTAICMPATTLCCQSSNWEISRRPLWRKCSA